MLLLRHFEFATVNRMPLDLEALRKEVEAYLEEDGVPVFRGYHRVIDAINQVTWDADAHPDFRDFIAVGKKAGANLFVYSSQSFSLDQIDDAMDMLEDTMLSHEEKRNFEIKLRQLQAYEGFTCAIDLSFTLDGQTYSFSRDSEWYRSLNDIIAELDALAEVTEAEEQEDNGLGGYFSKN